MFIRTENWIWPSSSNFAVCGHFSLMPFKKALIEQPQAMGKIKEQIELFSFDGQPV